MATYSNTNVGVLNLELYAGDRNHLDLTFTSGGSVWNMTGAVLSAQIRERASATSAVLDATITEVDASIGKWLLEWDGETIRTLMGVRESWRGVWDLQVVEAGQTLPETLLRGTVTAYMDVTR